MPIVTKPDAAVRAERQEIARNYLRLARTDMEEVRADLDQVTTARNQHIVNARAYGLSHQAIADELGITETAVRKIIASTGR